MVIAGLSNAFNKDGTIDTKELDKVIAKLQALRNNTETTAESAKAHLN